MKLIVWSSENDSNSAALVRPPLLSLDLVLRFIEFFRFTSSCHSLGLPAPVILKVYQISTHSQVYQLHSLFRFISSTHSQVYKLHSFFKFTSFTYSPGLQASLILQVNKLYSFSRFTSSTHSSGLQAPVILQVYKLYSFSRFTSSTHSSGLQAPLILQV